MPAWELPRLSLNRLLFFAALLTLTPLAVACGGGDDDGAEGGGDDDASKIRSAVQQIFDAASDGDWEGMYDAMSVSFRDRCPFEQFTLLAEASEEAIAKRTLSDVQDVVVLGDAAEATVVVEISGSPISGTFAFVREEGTWHHNPRGGPNSGCMGVF